MEYKKDKRTKNLTLRDIHIGDWVQEWSPIPEKYSPPMKVSCINYDGTVYLVPDDENYCTPYETEIENVDVLPITPELLKGFGFEIIKKAYPLGESEVFYNDKRMCGLLEYNNIYEIATTWHSYWYFHKFIDDIYERFPEILKLEWKGT